MMREPSNDNRVSFFSGPNGLLRREDFNSQNMEWLREELEKRNVATLSPEECEKNRLETLKNHKGDLWIFAYGSLIWNPALNVSQSKKTAIPGWRRSFCIDLMMARGSPRRPGLMLALDKGGKCTGVAHCIKAANIASETPLLWLREMTARTYRPVWVEAEVGGKNREILTFAIDQNSHLYAGNLELPIQARRIATAEGQLGTNRDYLYRCADELKRLKISDPYIEDLEARTRALAGDNKL